MSERSELEQRLAIERRIAALEAVVREKVGPLTGDDLWCEKPIWRHCAGDGLDKDHEVCGKCWTCRARALLQ